MNYVTYGNKCEDEEIIDKGKWRPVRAEFIFLRSTCYLEGCIRAGKICEGFHKVVYEARLPRH